MFWLDGASKKPASWIQSGIQPSHLINSTAKHDGIEMRFFGENGSQLENRSDRTQNSTAAPDAAITFKYLKVI